MNSCESLKPYDAKSVMREVMSPDSLLYRATITVRGEPVDILATSDFAVDGPWTTFFRDNLETLRNAGFFENMPLTEFGVGDGRNILCVYPGPTETHGVDVDDFRLDAARKNVDSQSISDVTLYHNHAVEYLQAHINNDVTISGRGIMCLPQSPAGGSSVGTFDDMPGLVPYKEWDQYGLTLNAATLDKLSQVADPDFLNVVILSDRVPQHVRKEMIGQTGWDVVEEVQTPEPILQSVDVPIGWASNFEGGRYWKKENGTFFKISVEVAENRRAQHFDADGDPAELNVYHHLSVYVLKPREQSIDV